MEDKFLAYFSQFRALTVQEKAAIKQNLVIRDFEKSSFVLMAGQEPVYNYFVLSGCVRKYYLNDGEESVTDFFTEEDWIFPSVGTSSDAVADYFLECLEDTVLVVAGEREGNELLQEFPQFRELAMQMLEKEVLRQQVQIANYQNATPEERYLRLERECPDLLERVPQFQLSSYIGVRPESLSRIRKRLSTRSEDA